MKRREFSNRVKAEIIRRATKGENIKVVYCEACGLQAKRWQIDHTIADALQIDKSKPLTAADGKLLCSGSPERCHDLKTNRHDKPVIAKTKRIEYGHLRIKKAKRSKFPVSLPEQKRATKQIDAKPTAIGLPEIARRYGATR